MAVCMVFSPPKSFYTKETYAKVMELLGELKGDPPFWFAVLDIDSEWVRSFSCEDLKPLIVCRGPIRMETMTVYEEMGIGVEDLMQYVSLFEVERTIK